MGTNTFSPLANNGVSTFGRTISTDIPDITDGTKFVASPGMGWRLDEQTRLPSTTSTIPCTPSALLHTTHTIWSKRWAHHAITPSPRAATPHQFPPPHGHRANMSATSTILRNITDITYQRLRSSPQPIQGITYIIFPSSWPDLPRDPSRPSHELLGVDVASSVFSTSDSPLTSCGQWAR